MRSEIQQCVMEGGGFYIDSTQEFKSFSQIGNFNQHELQAMHDATIFTFATKLSQFEHGQNKQSSQSCKRCGRGGKFKPFNWLNKSERRTGYVMVALIEEKQITPHFIHWRQRVQTTRTSRNDDQGTPKLSTNCLTIKWQTTPCRNTSTKRTHKSNQKLNWPIPPWSGAKKQNDNSCDDEKRRIELYV